MALEPFAFREQFGPTRDDQFVMRSLARLIAFLITAIVVGAGANPAGAQSWPSLAVTMVVGLLQAGYRCPQGASSHLGCRKFLASKW